MTFEIFINSFRFETAVVRKNSFYESVLLLKNTIENPKFNFQQ